METSTSRRDARAERSTQGLRDAILTLRLEPGTRLVGREVTARLTRPVGVAEPLPSRLAQFALAVLRTSHERLAYLRRFARTRRRRPASIRKSRRPGV
jgi:hypothetical protein